MQQRFSIKAAPSPSSQASTLRSFKKQARITKKIRTAQGVWKFISLQRVNNRYVWDKREGHYFIEWWEGKRRCRELAGQTPSQAIEALTLALPASQSAPKSCEWIMASQFVVAEMASAKPWAPRDKFRWAPASISAAVKSEDLSIASAAKLS